MTTLSTAINFKISPEEKERAKALMDKILEDPEFQRLVAEGARRSPSLVYREALRRGIVSLEMEYGIWQPKR